MMLLWLENIQRSTARLLPMDPVVRGSADNMYMAVTIAAMDFKDLSPSLYSGLLRYALLKNQ